MDTIFALASARGKAGVAVVRVSGPRANVAGEALAGRLPPARQAGLRCLRGADGAVIDKALVLAFPEGGSFTGEPTVEFHLHGSVAVVRAVLDALSELPGLRMAEPGEFTRRALENERLDLSQVEGLADLVEAETEAQRVQAMRVFSGALGDKVERWRGRLIRAAALLEATIDFADEEVPEDVSPEVQQLLDQVVRELDAEVCGVRVAERVRDGFEVAIVGPTNAGKSTLLNRLAGRDAAITSEIAGTTRDVIEVRMDLRGIPVTILDTAGLRVGRDEVERLGIERAQDRAARADLRVFLLGQAGEDLPMERRGEDLVVVGKADLGSGDVSGLTGEGVDLLVDRITSVLEKRVSQAGLATRVRHAEAMKSAVAHLSEARRLVGSDPDRVEMVAEAVRAGIRSLESVVGRVDVERVLDEIFASFCLGK